jgi:hypothetical protein
MDVHTHCEHRPRRCCFGIVAVDGWEDGWYLGYVGRWKSVEKFVFNVETFFPPDILSTVEMSKNLIDEKLGSKL